MKNIKIPETFRVRKDLEEKIEKLVKKVEELERNCIISTKCCKHKEENIILNFDKGKPVGIICDSYTKATGTCERNLSQTCRYISGFTPLQPNPDEEYKK